MKHVHFRLWSRAQITETGCWLWTGTKNNFGYGKISFQGKMVYVHRLAYWLTRRRKWPKGGHILHLCDTPSCFNPRHLRGGSQSLNIKHQWRRGKRRRAPKEIAA